MMNVFYKVCAAWIVLQFAVVSAVFSQGVGINENGASPDPSAILDIFSTTKGTLISRMTTEERNAIADPATGLFIFNTTTNCFNVWNGNSWRQWCGECDFTPLASSNAPLCEGETLNLFCTPMPQGATFIWSGPDGFTSTQQNPSVPNAAAANSGSYSLVVTHNGCSSNPAATVVTVNPQPDAPSVSNNGPLCVGQNLQLSGPFVTGASYSWTGPNNFSASTQNATLNGVSGTQAGTYELVLDVEGCTSAPGATTLVVNSSAPAQPGAISGGTNVATNSTGNVYSVSPVASATSYNWTLPTGAAITSGAGTNSITVSFDNTTGNIGSFTVSASNGCGAGPVRTLANITAQNYSSPMTYNPTGTGSTGQLQTFVVPSGVTSLTIETWGAEGGRSNYNGGAIGGKGAYMKGTFTVTPGQELKVLVGQAGGEGSTSDGGGGGGTFVVTSTNTPLIIAGGGGGAGWNGTNRPGVNGTTSTSGTSNNGGSGVGGSGGSGGGALRASGGGGFTGNGASGSSGGLPGIAFLNGGQGGAAGGPAGGAGGYGGGAGGPGGQNGGGGGGGYSGGAGAGEAGGWENNGGGGGGSYNAGTSQTNTSGVQTGHGKVVFTW